jgi:hypothetical protein
MPKKGRRVGLFSPETPDMWTGLHIGHGVLEAPKASAEATLFGHATTAFIPIGGMSHGTMSTNWSVFVFCVKIPFAYSFISFLNFRLLRLYDRLLPMLSRLLHVQLHGKQLSIC